MRGPGDAYITPGFYASKLEHGRVVPTWNYVTAHVYGELVVHDDPVWVEDLVRRLTGKHEAYREHPWSVDDAPRAFIEGQLRAIVGVELVVSRIEAKAKLSQNRSAEDVEGVIAGLRERGDKEAADAVERANSERVRGYASATPLASRSIAQSTRLERGRLRNRHAAAGRLAGRQRGARGARRGG